MTDMAACIRFVVDSGDFELADMLGKIDACWVQGSLTDGERGELTELARSKADPMGALPGVAERVAALELRVSDAESRLAALEDAQGGGTDPEPADEYPAWHTPTGEHDCYKTGMKMTYTDGKRYVCIAPEGYGVTYGPDVLPDMWQLAEGE